MPKSLRVELSLTETHAFRRLVAFVNEIDDIARINADDELAALVRQVRIDLLGVWNASQDDPEAI